MCSRHFSIVVFLFFLMTFATLELHAQKNDIVGATTVNEILKSDPVYQIYIDRYQPDRPAIKFLNAVQDSITIRVFIGTWCRESKKYIPGLIKTLKAADSPNIHISYIGVDAEKKLPETFLKTYDIKYIPTVIVLRGKKEIGRIEEAPRQLIETELVKILNEQAISDK